MEHKELLEGIYKYLENDGFGYWLPEWCISVIEEKPNKPSFEEFLVLLGEEIKYRSN